MKTNNTITLSVKNKTTTICSKTGINEVFLVIKKNYEEMDTIEFNSTHKGYYVIQIDGGLNENFVYYDGGTFYFSIPFGEKLKSYNPMAFQGDTHYIHVRIATKDEIKIRKNLAKNTLDNHNNSALFPHAFANVETRGESVFAARNAIDGVIANDDHGIWPYTSWGINQNPKAALTIDFGREVIIDELAIYLRADFPHDSYWKRADIKFSDGSSETLRFIKTHDKQAFLIKPRIIKSLTIKNLIKADNEESPFPALTQIKVYGVEK